MVQRARAILEVALPTLAHGPMHAGASGYGLILAAFSAGALAGGLFAGMLGRLKHKGLISLLVVLVLALSIALTPYWGCRELWPGCSPAASPTASATSCS